MGPPKRARSRLVPEVTGRRNIHGHEPTVGSRPEDTRSGSIGSEPNMAAILLELRRLSQQNDAMRGRFQTLMERDADVTTQCSTNIVPDSSAYERIPPVTVPTGNTVAPGECSATVQARGITVGPHALHNERSPQPNVSTPNDAAPNAAKFGFNPNLSGELLPVDYHLDDKLRHRIWSNEAIDLSLVLNKDDPMYKDLHKLVADSAEGTASHVLLNEHRWISAWNIFQSIYTRRHPQSASGLSVHFQQVHKLMARKDDWRV